MTKGIISAVACLFLGCAEPENEPPATEPAEVEESLLAWSFEPASADCNGWSVLQGAEAIRASPPRSGAYSCKICATAKTIDLGLGRDLGAVPSGRYVLSAWVRKRPQNEAPGEAIARIEADGPRGAFRAEASPITVREEWDRLEATLDLDEGADRLRIRIGAPSADAERCLFIDDVTLTRR